MRDASICGLGQTANDAVRTGLRFTGVQGAGSTHTDVAAAEATSEVLA
jgi:hypothetical protein